MARLIRPRRVHWPSLFWSRAEGSWLENDLVCRDCLGRGHGVSRKDAWEGITVEEVACLTCRSSGLLVPARQLLDDPEALWAADEAGAGWIDWLGHTGDRLVWPLPWAWTIGRRKFVVKQDIYVGGDEVLAFMRSGSVVVGLHELDESSRGRLEAVFKLACGKAAEVPVFVMPGRVG